MPTAADSALPIATARTSEPPANKRPLPEAAVRALAEAAARRGEGARAKGKTGKAGEPDESQAGKEVGGRGGLDPTRYGDWEVNGLASDF